MNDDWSESEVKIVVEDYFAMLQLELNHEKYNKTRHRESIISLLDNRSDGAIEFKHQNISAALISMGMPFIKGYKPLFNYQKQLLEKAIAVFIINNEIFLEGQFKRFADDRELIKPDNTNFEYILDEQEIKSDLKESEPLYHPVKINYLEREQNNRDLGQQGEEFVIEYEKWRLQKAGKGSLINKIEWVSKELGDGLGYDILSRNINGSDRFIEVKTTKLSKETPIYLSKTELSFSLKQEKDFYLYRVFNFDSKPKMFIKNGEYESFCKLIPQSYKGYF
jgi:hypothetical protein